MELKMLVLMFATKTITQHLSTGKHSGFVHRKHKAFDTTVGLFCSLTVIVFFYKASDLHLLQRTFHVFTIGSMVSSNKYYFVFIAGYVP